jgi:hypothetical protein
LISNIMNASFRTAFWAMCLGLTVPMVLFIGVELISPGSTARKASVAAADRNASLQTRLQTAAAKPANGRSRSPGPDPDARTTTSLGQNTSPGEVIGPAPAATDSAEPQVVLGPELEPEQSPGNLESGTDRRVPAVPAHTRPKVRILPDIEPMPAGDGRTGAAIEERLAGIQTNLDKIGRTLDAQIVRDQSPREPPVDAVKQVTEFLRQLHEARQRDGSSPAEDSFTRTPADENRESDDGQKQSATLPPTAAHETAPHEIDPREAERKPQPVTRIYRPRYLSGSALQSLVEPLLTRDLGKTGAADAEAVDSGTGNGGSSSGSPANALVVRDLPQVMRKIDQLIARLDVPPTQVALEVVVITLQLNAGSPQGIDLRTYNATGQHFVVAPVDAGPASAETGSQATGGRLTLTNGFGLKCGVLTGDPQAFISALEAVTPGRSDGARSARAWQMTVGNRQSAALMLNDPFGPTGASNEFASGTMLKIRPVVDRSGLVQLDVRREVALDGPASGSRSAALTNQISLHDGQTAVVGGFFAEQTALQFYRRSGIGQLPLVGGMFLKQAEVIERCETIVLLTPHVIASVADAESQFVRKQPPPKKTKDRSTIPASHAGEPRAEKAQPQAQAPPPPPSPPRITPARGAKTKKGEPRA